MLESIREIAKSNGLNIKNLEQLSGLGNGVIGKWEKGERSPTLESLKRISTFLNVSVSELIGETPVDTANPAPNSGDGMLDELLSLASRLSEPELQREIAYLRERVAAQDKPVSPPPSAGKTAE